MYIMKVKPEYFEKIKSGDKKYEIRLLDEKRQQFKVGDSILLKKEPDLMDGLVIRILEVRRFLRFFEMAQKMSLAELGFEGKNAREVEEICHSIYTPEEEKKYGVVVFKIEVL